MEEIQSSDISVYFYHAARHHIPEANNIVKILPYTLPYKPILHSNFTHRNVLLIHCTAVSMVVVPLDRMSLSVRFQTMIIIKYSATEVIFCFSEHQSSVSLCISVT